MGRIVRVKCLWKADTHEETIKDVPKLGELDCKTVG